MIFGCTRTNEEESLAQSDPKRGQICHRFDLGPVACVPANIKSIRPLRYHPFQMLSSQTRPAGPFAASVNLSAKLSVSSSFQSDNNQSAIQPQPLLSKGIGNLGCQAFALPAASKIRISILQSPDLVNPSKGGSQT
jgi:hypothetical protein